MGVSIRDVAKTAGVSVSTVSRALNGYTDVSEKTKNKIQKTVQQLGYVPNQSAKNLSSKNTKNIALIVFDLYKVDKLNEFTTNILRGVYEYANERGSTLATYGISEEMQKNKKLADMCSEYSLSGVILMGLKMQDKYLKEARTLRIPCVTIDVKVEGKNTATIMTDDITAFEEITDYVLDHGHKKVVLIKGKEEAEVTLNRFLGFKKSVERHGIDLQNIEIINCHFDQGEAFEKTIDYLKKNGKREATAFICMSDLMALGVSRAMLECGYSIPEDFSVTGFDGIYALDYINPGITTIDQNIIEKGYVGVRVLNDMLEGKEVQDNIFVPHKLVIRESVKENSI